MAWPAAVLPCFISRFLYRPLNVMDQINSVGADISKIESRSFCERYAFVKGNELAVIEFWYNKSSQFTKVQPMPQLSNSTRLIDEIICQIGVLL
ncbi:hypothetical protein [Klebsiella quasipneumoniae]|uniref:hypothetical protein n=1 Tax=Klebsiella quasipneumoniae TaxID=1463165 RepID=UPI001250886F